MLEQLFGIDKYNIVSDDEYYYFFRALNNRDHKDIQEGITFDSEGLKLIKTDRQYYEGVSKYSSDNTLSLEEIVDHIKIHHRIDTNCISLTSNSNIGIMYGREYYHQEYAIVKVKKENLGNQTVLASLYILKQIIDKINEYVSSSNLDEKTIYYLNRIDSCVTEEQLSDILSELGEFKYIENVTIKESSDFSSLSKRQNLEKNKIITKINILGIQILRMVSNQTLIQTLGIALSSLELIHYNEITKDKIISCPKEIMDIFSLLQQSSNSRVKELELILIKYLNNPSNIDKFKYEDITLDDDISLEDFYNLTDGKLDYNTLYIMYKKLFYMSKSKLRTIYSVQLLRNIIGSNEYDDVLNELLNNTYCVEPSIFIKSSNRKISLSESVGLDFDSKEDELFKIINSKSMRDLSLIVSSPMEALEMISYEMNIKNFATNKDVWFASAIIDLYDWKKLDIKHIDYNQRMDLLDSLISNGLMEKYNLLKGTGLKEKEIAKTLLVSIIKNKEIDLDNIDLNEDLTLEEIELFLGYCKIEGTNISLRSYQRLATERIETIFKEKKFTSAILPTGGGKTFVAIDIMLKHEDKNILYIAPSDVILNQLLDNIIEYVIGKQGTFNMTLSYQQKLKIVHQKFPNFKLCTYSYLNSQNQDKIINNKYDLIVLDELHRSGAKEWKRKIEKLLDNQDENVRVLGLTATPTRDCDGVDMADYWARYLGYNNEEINKHIHLAINMDLIEAIKMGYVLNPRLVTCYYELLNTNGELDNLNELIKSLNDGEEKNKLIRKLDNLRRKISDGDGVEKALKNNLKKGKRYIVYLPVTNNAEDEDGNIIDSKITGEEVIKKYGELLKSYLGEENIQLYSMLGSYSKSKNSIELSRFERAREDKINLMLVMNKLNEGYHAQNDGIIWFRPLDENSLILYLQQLGRIIRTLKPGEEIAYENLPVALDLACNSLKVRLNKHLNSTTKQSDLDKLIIIKDWIERYGIPDINSKVVIESRYASILKSIQKKYLKYMDKDLLEQLDKDTKEEIEEILRLGISIDLWNIQIGTKKKIEKNANNQIDDLFTLTEVEKLFYELEDEINLNDSKEKRIEEIFEFVISHDEKTPSKESKDINEKKLANWFFSKKNYIIEQATEKKNQKAMYIALRAGGNLGAWIKVEEAKKYYPEDTMIEGFPLYPKNLKENRVEEIFEFMISHDEKTPLQDSKDKNEIKLANWLFSEKNYIIEQATERKNPKAMYIALRAGGHKGAWIKVEEAIKYHPQDTMINGVNLYPSKQQLTKGEYIEEIFKFMISHDEKTPSRKSKDNNEKKLGTWLSSKKNYIIEQAKEKKNSKAMCIALRVCGNLGAWIKVEEAIKDYPEDTMIEGFPLYPKNLKENRVEEIFEFMISHDEKTPSKESKDNNEKKLGDWLHNNKTYIIEQATEKKNQKAIYIALRTGGNLGAWIKVEEVIKDYPQDTMINGVNLYPSKQQLTKGEYIEEVFEFMINHNEKVPSKFSLDENEKKLANWLFSKKNYIIEQATEKKNQEAMYIALRTGGHKGAWIKVEEAIKYHPQDTMINEIKLYPSEQKLTKEEYIEEVFEFMINHDGKTPLRKSKDNNEKKLGNWFSANKKYIMSQTKDNEKAMYIALRAGGNLGVWIKVEEAIKYYPSDYLVDGYPLYPSGSNNKKETSESTISFSNINTELSKQVTEDGYKLTSTDDLTTKSKTKKKK